MLNTVLKSVLRLGLQWMGILRTFAPLNDSNILWHPLSSRIHWKRKLKLVFVLHEGVNCSFKHRTGVTSTFQVVCHLKNYFNNHAQRNMVQSWFSTWRLIKNRVPQISVLLNIFIRVLEEDRKKSLIMFANGIELRAGLPWEPATWPGGVGWGEA